MHLSVSGHRQMVDTGEIRVWTVARAQPAPWPLPLTKGEGKAGAVGRASYSASWARCKRGGVVFLFPLFIFFLFCLFASVCKLLDHQTTFVKYATCQDKY